MSLQPTSRPLERPTIRLRVGRISQPLTTGAFTEFVRTGAGTSSDRRRHALGESDGSLHIAGSLEKTRCSAVPLGYGRPFLGSPHSALDAKGRASRRLTTPSKDLWAALVDEPMAQLPERAMPIGKFFASG